MLMNDFMIFYVKDVIFYRDEFLFFLSNMWKIVLLCFIFGFIDVFKNGGNEDYLIIVDVVCCGEVNIMLDMLVGKILFCLMCIYIEEVISVFVDGMFFCVNIEVFIVRMYKVLVDFYEDVKKFCFDVFILMQFENLFLFIE